MSEQGRGPDRPALPPRVRVSGPSRHRPGPRPAHTAEIDEGTPVGALLLGSLLREQLRLALGVLLLLAVTVGALPLLFHLAPEAAGWRLGGLPLPWLLLGVVVYPYLLLLGWAYVRRAEHNEDAFAELMTERDPDDPASPDGPTGVRP